MTTGRLRAAWAVLRGRTVVYRARVDRGSLMLTEKDGFVINESVFVGVPGGWVASGRVISILLRLRLIRARTGRAAIYVERSKDGLIANSRIHSASPASRWVQ